MSLSRRRVLALLTLTTILLLTFDLRGSATIDSAKRTFSDLMGPLQDGGRAATRPLERAWRGITEYERLKKENDELRQLVDAQTGDQLAAQVAQQEMDQLERLVDLNVEYSTLVAQVQSYSPQNFQQTVEINRGRSDGIRVGMAVLSAAGLVGKVTAATDSRATVMLLTDSAYTVAVKLVGPQPVSGSSEDPDATAPPTTTTVAPGETTTTLPPLAGELPTTTVDPLATTSTSSTTTTTISATTTTTPLEDLPQRELGGLEGQGRDRPPIVALIDSSRRALEIEVGDIVATSGGCPSLAPPNLSIGTVSKVTARPGSQGPEIEVEPAADLGQLNFVLVVLYLPSTEVSGETCN